MNVHPVVLFGILDQHVRRVANQRRALGFLMGTTTGGVVEVTNSFGVSYKEQDGEVHIRRDNPKDMIALLRRVNDKEQVVGWYSTLPTGSASPPIDEFTLAVHSFVENFCRNPIHLLVDTSLAKTQMPCSAYQAYINPNVKDVLVAFQPLKVNVIASHEERVGLDAIAKATGLTSSGPRFGGKDAATASGITDLEGLETSMRRLKGLLDSTLSYVDDVVAGKAPADEALGREIADTLAAVPAVDPAAFEATFSSSVQDLLMVSYLAQITSAQCKLAERLHLLPSIRR